MNVARLWFYYTFTCIYKFSEEDNVRTSFSIGEDSDNEGEECSTLDSKTTQTDQLVKELVPLKRLPRQQPPRALKECVRILRSDVSMDKHVYVDLCTKEQFS